MEDNVIGGLEVQDLTMVGGGGGTWVLSRRSARVQNIQCRDKQGRVYRAIFKSTSRMSRRAKCSGRRSESSTRRRLPKISSIGNVADEILILRNFR